MLVSLDATYGYQNVNIIAHSMGNVVTSEALRLAATQATPVPVVNAYIATQAATPAEAYQPTKPGNTNDVYNNFMGTGKSYFADLNKAAPNMYNFFNPNDFAVGIGSTDRWMLNNLTKPDSGYNSWIVGYDMRGKLIISKTDFTDPKGRHLLYSSPAARYEAFAFAAWAKSTALGGTANVGGPFNTAKQIDLSTPQFGLVTDHSGEFDGTEQWRRNYWFAVMDHFGLNHWQ